MYGTPVSQDEYKPFLAGEEGHGQALYHPGKTEGIGCEGSCLCTRRIH
jgi:hypothetical protein